MPAAHELIDLVARRVRDTQNLAHSRAFVRDRLTDCQRLVNTALNLIVESTPLATEPAKVVYPIAGLIPNAVRITAVREGGRDLARLTNLTQLHHLNLKWFREQGDRFEAWCHIGRDLLVIYPAKPVTSEVEIRHTALLDALTGESSPALLPDEYLPPVLKLCEAMLLIRQRDFTSAMAAMQELPTLLQADMLAYRLHAAGPDDAVASRATTPERK